MRAVMMKIHQEKGFTLIEVLAAVTVFSIGIIAAASMQGISTRNSTKARYITEGTVATVWEMEGFMNIPFTHDDLADRRNMSAEELAALTTTASLDYGGDGRYTITWQIQDNVPAPNTKTVAMTIRPSAEGLEQGLFPFNPITLHKVLADGALN